jgi:hypothetical protein
MDEKFVKEILKKNLEDKKLNKSNKRNSMKTISNTLDQVEENIIMA